MTDKDNGSWTVFDSGQLELIDYNDKSKYRFSVNVSSLQGIRADGSIVTLRRPKEDRD